MQHLRDERDTFEKDPYDMLNHLEGREVNRPSERQPVTLYRMARTLARQEAISRSHHVVRGVFSSEHNTPAAKRILVLIHLMVVSDPDLEWDHSDEVRCHEEL